MSRKIGVVATGRWDRTPLSPVVEEIIRNGDDIIYIDLDGFSVSEAAHHTDDVLRSAGAPDILLVLGDRYETLASCNVATYWKIPIAHVHGGEETHGSFDNQIRDAITKLSHIHFAATYKATSRLILQLGENSKRIHRSGAPGLDNLKDLPPRSPEKLFMVTYHPATLGQSALWPLWEALQAFPDYQVMWSRPNSDPVDTGVPPPIQYTDLTPRSWLVTTRSMAAAVIGNSSFGIIEAPTLGVPTVDIGERQAGRERGPSVRHSNTVKESILETIQWSLGYHDSYENPYYREGASSYIANVLSTVNLDGILIK